MDHARYTRRDVLKHAAWAIPAFHLGFGSSTTRRVLARDGESQHRFRALRLTANPQRLGALETFYSEVLHLPVDTKQSDGLSVQAGSTRIDFRADADAASPFYHFAFNIPENKMDQAIDWMSKRAPLLKNRDGNHIVYFDWLDAHSIYFYDPAGNLLEFIAHHPLRNGRMGDFGVEDILYASEIGLVTKDVPALAAELEGALALTNYAVQRGLRSSDEFRPIGDPFGFFILVKHKRPWLMSDVPAELFAVDVELRDKTKRDLKLNGCECKLAILEQ